MSKQNATQTKPQNTNMLETLRPNESSLMALIDIAKPRLMKRAAESLQHATPEKQNQFLSRTVAAIVKNEKLAPCFTSHEGRVSIYLLIDDALKTGLELDKHAYAVPYPRLINKGQNEIWITEAKFQIKRQGYHALLCGGEKPIFEDLRWGTVYEKDPTASVDEAAGEVKHIAAIVKNRGDVIGVWVQIIKLNGGKEAKFFEIDYINSIRDNYSKSYNKYPDSSPWTLSPIPMAEKTAIKAFCSPYADVKDELANALYSERDEGFANPEETRDNETLADTIIDGALDNMGEGNQPIRNVNEEKPPGSNPIKKTTTNNGKSDKSGNEKSVKKDPPDKTDKPDEGDLF